MSSEVILFKDPRKEVFCREYVKTGKISHAYRIATGKPKGTSVQKIAKEWLNDPQVQERIKMLQMEMARMTNITLEEHLQILSQLRDQAATCEQFSAAITAEVNRGKVAGFYDRKDKQQDKPLSQLTTKELEQKLLELQETKEGEWESD